MVRRVLRSLPCALLILLGTSSAASAANVLVMSNVGWDIVAADFEANTSHTYTGWDNSVVPTLMELEQYDVVLLFENGLTFNGPDIGDAVREYVDGGGDVVIATFYTQNRSDNVAIGGFGWGTLEEVDPFTAEAGGCEYAADSLDASSIVAHPMTANLTELYADSYRGGETAKDDTVVLATWTGTNNNGEPDPVIGYRLEGTACIVGVSLFPDYESYGNYGTNFTGDWYPMWDDVLTGAAANCNSDCGNLTIDEGEDCDEGGETTTCDSDCTLVSCGDGHRNQTAGEACDGAGETTTCDADCTLVACGDGTINATANEVCDEGESETCDDDCTSVICGDANLNVTAGETCDGGGETATCDDDCSAASCGDGNVNSVAGETCDEGVMGRTATCNDDCTLASCGDEIVNVAAGEECDEGGISTKLCDYECTLAMCGDMLVNGNAGEDCDEGGVEAANCDADCSDAVCGDGTMNATAGEECDDGNTDVGDGCDASCATEGATATSSSGSSSESGSDGSSSTGDESTGGSDSSDSGDVTGQPPATGSTTAPDIPMGTMSGATSGEDTETEGDTGGAMGDEGCGCTTSTRSDRWWSILGLFALGLLRRRRPSR